MKLGPDNDSTTPSIEPAKKTTKVNISIVVAVIAFFVVGGLAIAWMKFYHG